MAGAPLIPDLVRNAREEEIQEFRKHKVSIKVPVKERMERAGKKPIGVKWVDVNEGGEEHSEYRSRFVAKEMKRGKGEDLFAATPPLEALTILLPLAITAGVG